VANTELILSSPQAKPQPLGSARAHSGEKARGTALSFARSLLALTKPRITMLVLATEAAGAYLAPGHAGARAQCMALAGTALIVGSANTLNMWWEREIDARMERTRNRPLPAGRLSPEVALGFGLALAVVAVPMLFMVNVATALLGVAALLSYVAVYTPLKRHTHLALLVGAVPGAIPPLLGWATVTGTIGLGGLLLFAVLFLWQIPHFAAITICRADDYRRAGLQVVSVQHGERAARQTIALYTVLLVVASLLFVPFGLAGAYYPIAATSLGAAFLALAFRGLRGGARFESTGWAKHVFAFSVIYLPALLIALLVHRSPG
jgi:protoheme IX farnesyltransferase